MSERGKKTLTYRGYEYWHERDNVCGTTSWRCRQNQRLKCKARCTTSGTRVVGDRQPDHTHSGNISTALARRAVGEMKEKMGELMVTPSSSQAAVMSSIDDQILMALPKRSLVTRVL